MSRGQSINRSLLRAVEAELQAEKQRISEEIRCYPPPIPACDAQFNYLLEQRNRVAEEVGRFRAACNAEQSTEQRTDALRKFIASSVCLSPSTKEEMAASFLKSR